MLMFCVNTQIFEITNEPPAKIISNVGTTLVLYVEIFNLLLPYIQEWKYWGNHARVFVVTG